MLADIAKTNFGDLKLDIKRPIREYDVIYLIFNQ